MITENTYVSIADPAQSSNIIHVEIETAGKVYQKDITMPLHSELKGSTVTVDFEIPTNNITTKESQLIQIDCFPNPTSHGIIHIHANNANTLLCDVRNINGKIILKKQFNHQGTINLQQQPPGIYFVSVYHNNQTFSRRIIKH